MPETQEYRTDAGSMESLTRELDRVHEKLDHLTEAMGRIDRRREELEDLLADLIPVANGAMSVAAHRLNELERSGSLRTARDAVSALEAASRRIDPRDLAALGENAGPALRALRTLTEPELADLSERLVRAVRSAHTGRPPGLLALLRGLRKPRARRGLGAVLAVLRVLGEGARPGAGRRGGMDPHATPRSGSPASPRAGVGPAHGSLAGNGGPAGNGGRAGSSTAQRAGHTREIGGRAVAFDADGFLVDPAAWTPEVAETMAAEVGIEPLTEEHWRVLEFCRSEVGPDGSGPGLRRITKALGIPPKAMYTLFPKGPGLLASRLAGIGKPKSCV